MSHHMLNVWCVTNKKSKLLRSKKKFTVSVMAAVMSWSFASFFQEGPHSALNEDEFFDALEMAYQEDELEGVR